jgi:isoleucyl-tRNA synthetase
VGIKEKAPYNSVVTHGWTLDEKGTPMSKSLGNTLYPAEICERWGADLLRLWVASVEYQADVKMSERVMTQLSEAYRKIRNTFRFALSNLFDFNPSRDALASDQLEELDRWMLERTAELAGKCREWYVNYEFHRVYHAIHDFCVVDLSAFYYDVLKDRLYTKAAKSKTRRSAQTAVWKITSALVRLAAPILVFTTEEIWKYLPKSPGDSESVHMALFPQEEELRSGLDSGTKASWSSVAEQFRPVVLAALEQARNEKRISSSLQAKVTLKGEVPEAQLILERHREQLRYLFIVSQALVTNDTLGNGFRSDALKGLAVRVDLADGKKCERCWNYSTHVGENKRYPTICERCSEALAEIETGLAAHN